MAYIEHLSGNKYRLVARDPAAIGRKRISQSVEVPPEVAKSERKKKQWLDLELAKFAEKVENGEVVRLEKMTLEQFLPKWKSGYADQRLGEYTRKNTLDYISRYIVPVFGASRLDQIKPLHIVTFLAELRKRDGSPMATNTKLNIFKALKSIFDSAKKWQLIATNPIEGVDRPSPDKKEKREMRQRKKSFNRNETEAVITALYALPDQWRLYFIGVLLGGFRRGEFLAVEWPQVDFERLGIHVVKQITLDEVGNKIEGELKTEESEAFVPMPRWYMEELQAYRKQWNKEKLRCKDWKGDSKQYVFHGGQGIMYYPSTATGTWRKFLIKNGLPKIRLHDLRHTTATLLRENGKDLKTIQERLRHARLETTANIYTHESDLVSRDAADSLEVLNPKISKFAPRSAPQNK
ncbi:site-specific integrase [Paenibacillus sp.]|uniref:tyrosine-type recombinase/integrase n=1 Tax=Paenibacillus sp. TaxID=58172 RepID=UPI002D3500CD|nr:site-specific integrase [Paenibacillus sp.]HZG83874.1 site-specific integrase [Paenibacillus sp.]